MSQHKHLSNMSVSMYFVLKYFSFTVTICFT